MTTMREKISRYYKGQDGAEIVPNILDMIEKVLRSQKFQITDFLSPLEQEIVSTIVKQYEELTIHFDGGYQGAERKKATIAYYDFLYVPKVEISLIVAKFSSAKVSHRDVLGSVLGLGIERKYVGDILLGEEEAKILVATSLKDFVLSNYEKIGSVKVTCQEGELLSIVPREARLKEIKATVASPRLDAIVSTGFGISRTRATTDIEAEKVQLNFQTVKNPAKAIKEGDKISFRGRGRLEVSEIRGRTKKGRLGVTLHRYL